MKQKLQVLIVPICLLFLLNSYSKAQIEPTDTDGNNIINIKSIDHLRWVSENPTSWDKDYELDNNINAGESKKWNSGKGFNPIGNHETDFSGTFDGKGYVIDSLFIDDNTNNNAGFIGYLDSTTIRDIHLTNINVRGKIFTGSLVGYANFSNIINCSATGKVFGSDNTGGLIGAIVDKTICKESYFDGDVIGTDDVGGFIGDIATKSEIIDCYSENTVEGNNRVGGFSGECSFSDIQNCYAKSEVKGNFNIGGFLGICFYGNVIRSYIIGSVEGNRYVAGFCSKNSGVIANSYCVAPIVAVRDYGAFLYKDSDGAIINCVYNSDVSNVSDCHNCFGYEEAVMKNIQTYNDISWNSDAVWGVDANINDGYPFFIKNYNNTPMAEEAIDSDGNGYLEIKNLANLYWLNNNPEKWKENYELTNNIDAYDTRFWDYGNGFNPIGFYGKVFTGNFDGGGYKIKNLYINRPHRSYVAMFGRIRNSTLSSINLENVEFYGYYYSGGVCGINQTGSINSCSVSGKIYCDKDFVGGINAIIFEGSVSECSSTATLKCNDFCGGISAWNNHGTVKNCISTSNINAQTYVGGLLGYNYFGYVGNSKDSSLITAKNVVGGLIGEISYKCRVDKCVAFSEIIANNIVGGFVGLNNATRDSIISNSSAVATIIANNLCGGFAGINNSKIMNCYTRSSVNCTDSAAGFVAKNDEFGFIEESYSATNNSGKANFGNFCINNTGDKIDKCFWDVDLNSTTFSDGGDSLHTDVFFDRDSLISLGWDFIDVWEYGRDNEGYPTLKKSFTATPTQKLILKKGWNMVSFNLLLKDSNIENLFAGVKDNLVIIKNGKGSVYYPKYDVDQLDTIDIKSGYLVYMNAADTLEYRGSTLPVNIDIDLVKGWNMIGYPKQNPVEIEQTVSNIIDNLVIIKNGMGLVFYPKYGVNYIGSFTPNQGYLIYMEEEDILYFNN
jgi:hypothetical protein